MATMTGRTTPAPCPFTPREREYIRRELDMFFGTLPSVAEGFHLRTWRGGPLAGQPKVPPSVRTMVERGLVEIRIGTRVPKVHFSEAASRLSAFSPWTGATWTLRNLPTSGPNLVLMRR